jgi:hypothetical protein
VRGVVQTVGRRIQAEGKENANLLIPLSDLMLLGIWQGSWDAPPDEVMAVEQGASVRVPVGMGIVTPIEKLVEILELPELAKERNLILGMWNNDEVAKPDAS